MASDYRPTAVAATISHLEKQRIIEVLDNTMAYLDAALWDGLVDEKVLSEMKEIYSILGVIYDR